MTKDRFYSFIDAVVKMRGMATDAQALEIQSVYPDWKSGVQYIVGERVLYNDSLYKVSMDHTSQSDWTPDVARTLFEPLDVVNEGTLENPIAAASGMRYYKDKYYFDETDGNIYLCTRQDTDDGTVLHFMPSALVGVYFSTI